MTTSVSDVRGLSNELQAARDYLDKNPGYNSSLAVQRQKARLEAAVRVVRSSFHIVKQD